MTIEVWGTQSGNCYGEYEAEIRNWDKALLSCREWERLTQEAAGQDGAFRAYDANDKEAEDFQYEVLLWRPL